jgi:hypothetical protein
MTPTRSTLVRPIRVLLALLALALLAFPTSAGHAAAGTNVAVAQFISTPFEARVSQGPDRGAYLAGTLHLVCIVHRDLACRNLTGRLLVQPLPQQRSLTSLPVVPVTGLVLPAQHAVLLSFALGTGTPLRVLATSSATSSSSAATPGQIVGAGQPGGSHSGDVLECLVIHIHIQGDGWSIDITIKI